MPRRNLSVSPVQYTARIALEAVDICGVQLRRGEPLLFMIAAANRDPQRFEVPDRLNLKRTNNPILRLVQEPTFA